MKIFEELAGAVVKGDERKVKQICAKVVELGLPVRDAIVKGLSHGMKIVGEKYEQREYFLADLILSAEIMRGGLNYLLPYLEEAEGRFLGKYVIGVVKGNIHDLGKNIVAAMLRAEGFEVYDLGVDVPPERFVEKVKEVDANLVGMSVYTSDALPVVGEVERALRIAGLRNKVKTMVGGAAASPLIAEKYGVDAYGKDSIEAVKIAKRLLQELHETLRAV